MSKALLRRLDTFGNFVTSDAADYIRSLEDQLVAERKARLEVNERLIEQRGNYLNTLNRAEAAEASLAAERKELDETEVLGKYDGVAGRRWWWSGGAWLYPGQKVVVIDAAKGTGK